MTYASGQVLTVFRSRLREEHVEEYVDTAAQMGEIARSLPGYVEHKVFTAGDGERVTVVTFADQESHDVWATHVEHRRAQRRGREAFYATYSLQVATVDTVSEFLGA